jgi:hypothetical protein
MPDESFPIEIEGETLALRFEDGDIREIEKVVSLFAAFHPSTRTYDNAALFLWHGLRRVDDSGELVYAIQQGPPGREMAFRMVKSFCQQFAGPAGMLVLYESYRRALVVSGWFGEPKEDPQPEGKPPEREEKNSQRPMKRPTSGSLSGFVASILKRFGR